MLTPPSLPNPSLILSYEEALLFVKARLKMFMHGELKHWLEQLEDSPSYTMVVGLKNDTLLKAAPRLLQRLLNGLGFTTELMQLPLEEGIKYGYQFENEKAHAEFKEHQARVVLVTEKSAVAE